MNKVIRLALTVLGAAALSVSAYHVFRGENKHSCISVLLGPIKSVPIASR